MGGDFGTWVPKVHPLARDAEAEDPFELSGQVSEGDPEVMLECLLQEFLWMGYGAEALWRLFDHPNYPLLTGLRERFGDAAIKNRIDDLVARCGIPTFRESIVESAEDVDEEEASGPMLVQIDCGVMERG